MSRSKIVCFIVLLVGWGSMRAVAQATSPRSVASQNAGVQVASGGAGGAPTGISSSLSTPEAPAAAVVVAVPPAPIAKKNLPDKKRVLPFSKLAISTKSSTLGAGGQVATPLMRGLNLRGGADFLNFGYAIGVDGANYEGQIHMKNGQVSLDWFPFNKQFHISPGFVIFKTALSASVYVPGGNSFDLGNNTFTSSTSDPVTGTASILFSHTIMPSLTFGFGNMIAKEGKHWSVPLEVGAAYTGHYTAQLSLQGSACIDAGCMSTSSALVQQSIVQEQNGLDEPMKHYQIYPIINSGLSYRF